jgi:cytochrome d ubiquinol oxidase subunit II
LFFFCAANFWKPPIRIQFPNCIDSPMLENFIAIAILVSLIFYALTGGADFGGGIWDLLAGGPRAKKQRHAIADAIGPIWEANHVWLILIVVLLFTGFPRAFSAMMTALNIPLTAMLIGIVVRGSVFVFRKYDSADDKTHRRWSAIFGAASFFTPFVQGMILGALTTGRIHFADGRVTTGFFAGWLTLFAFACGLFALGLFAFLAATYLTVETRGESELQNDFRLRAIWSGLALAPIALLVFISSKNGAPEMFHRLTAWWAPLLLIWTSLFAVVALVSLWRRRFVLASAAAIGQVTLILVGWSVAQFPNLIPPDITIANSAAPEATLRLLVLALGVGAIALFPSLSFLYYIFKFRRRPCL